MPKKRKRGAAADAATWELIRAEEARSAKKGGRIYQATRKPTKAPQEKSTAGKKASKKNNKSRREPESDSDESDDDEDAPSSLFLGRTLPEVAIASAGLLLFLAAAGAASRPF